MRKGGRFGPGPTNTKELTVLNRVRRLTESWYEHEADLRQAKKLLESLHLDGGCSRAATAAAPLSTCCSSWRGPTSLSGYTPHRRTSL